MASWISAENSEFCPEFWMEKALELASEAETLDEVPIGALLVRRNEVLGRGFNLREKSHRTAGHAEMEALEDFNYRYATWRLPPETALFVTAEPCLMCVGAMLGARLDYVFYGCRDPKNAGLRLVLPQIEKGTFDHRFQSISDGVLEESCAKILSHYFRQKRLAE